MPISTDVARIVVMGVSGSGKSTIARLLAEKLAFTFGEGDDFHSPSSVAKMASGIPLEDADRSPWLDDLGEWLAAQTPGGVLACSALKRRYRDRLRSFASNVFFVHLASEPDLARTRIAQREQHFMPSSLIASQFAALEHLDVDEAGCTLDAHDSPDALIDQALSHIGGAAMTHPQ